jgi:hypothetical protein
MTAGHPVSRRSAHANRTGLIVLGALLLAAGLAALARGLGLFGRDAAEDPLLTEQVAAFARENAWFWPAVAGLALLIAAIGLGWLLAQFRRERLRVLNLESGPSGITHIAGRTVCDALTTRLGRHPSVRRARATLRGRSDAPRLDLHVSAGDTERLRDLLSGIHDVDIPEVRESLGVERLPAVVRLAVAPRPHKREVH